MARVGQAHPEAAKCDQSWPHYRFHLAVLFRLFGPVHAWYRDRDAYLQWHTALVTTARMLFRCPSFQKNQSDVVKARGLCNRVLENIESSTFEQLFTSCTSLVCSRMKC
ncbi:unnamed protein product [Heterotrigona itama]|uniref:Uncharacterized protein n=1 Tax=Heterotrigona itama TaxID=395501 RepID=A0A6V7HE17_9HYME|nr:unnamed protein product [Heterotrigona itama]